MLDVIDLQKEGNQKPQFFLLTVRYPNKGEGYRQTIECGTEAFLRRLLNDEGIEGPAIDAMFKDALK